MTLRRDRTNDVFGDAVSDRAILSVLATYRLAEVTDSQVALHPGPRTGCARDSLGGDRCVAREADLAISGGPFYRFGKLLTGDQS